MALPHDKNRGDRIANLIGQYVLLLLILFVAIGSAVLITLIVTTPIAPTTSQAAATTQAAPGAPPAASGATTPNTNPSPPSAATPPTPGALGAFDPYIDRYSKYLLAGLVFLAAALVEMFLIIVYGTFYVNHPDNRFFPLGLPPATVRIFLVVVIVLVILIFALFPDVWGSNKAVVLLFGLLSTIIGFYFGSQNAMGGDGARPATIKLTLEEASKQLKPNDAKLLTGKLDENFATVFGGGNAQVIVLLLGNDGTPLPGSQRTGAVDTAGKVVFDYNTFNFPASPSSCIMKVVVPSAVVCDERISLVSA